MKKRATELTITDRVREGYYLAEVVMLRRMNGKIWVCTKVGRSRDACAKVSPDKTYDVF
jgi:hypothetical protein